MGKLVRDRIPEIIRSNGETPAVRHLETAEYEEALHEKLLEEAAELRNASTPDNRIEEAADVIEVVLGIAEFHGFTVSDVLRIAEKKRAARGGFAARIWLDQS
jgi:predicted house-cleaning noncanonical NTP pyrophosphatase (MazG superfamily)